MAFRRLLLLLGGRVPEPPPAGGPVSTLPPAVTGTPEVGQTLTSTTGTWTGDPTITYAFQWLRNGASIPGATASTYLVVSGDLGTALSCRVTATNGVGSASSTSAEYLVETPPVSAVAPVATGTPTVGQTLTSSSGTWTGRAPITFAYQWTRGGADISGATSSTYTLVSADAGATVACRVTATNGLGSASATSSGVSVAGLAPVSVDAPAVTGTPEVGQTLTSTTGTWTGTATIGFTYQWTRGGADISGATGSTYLLDAADLDEAVACRVTGTNAWGSASRTSASVTVSAGGGGAPATNGFLLEGTADRWLLEGTTDLILQEA